VPHKPGAQAGAKRLNCWMAALLAVILLAFGLRLFRLDYQSLWVDEATSAYLTTLPPAQIVLNRANGLHPPTYFLALASWAALAGHSEFSLRFFSVAVGLLLVPLLYRVGRRLFDDPRTGLLAALLAALSPAHVVYSQEARMYTGLPVAYLVALACVLAPNGLRTRRDWLWLAVSELACLYWHSFSAFIVLAVNLLLLVTRSWRADRRTWRRWITSQALVGLLYAVWPLIVWRWGVQVPAKLSRRDWRAAGMSLSRFLRQLWEFLNSGLLGTGKVDATARWLGALGVLLLLAALLAFLLDRRRKMLLAVAGGLFFPLIGAYPVWYMRPLAHPRYMLFLLAPMLIVMARALVVLSAQNSCGVLHCTRNSEDGVLGLSKKLFLGSRRWMTWAVGVALAVAILGSNVAALRTAFFDPRFFRFDMRALAAAVADRAAPGEAVIMAEADYSLWYYDAAPAELISLPGEAGAEGGRVRSQELAPLLAGRPGAFWVTYRDLREIDPRGQMPFLLEVNGRLVERFSVDRMGVDHYELEGWKLVDLIPAAVECEPLMLTGVYTQAAAMADNTVTVALRWRLVRPAARDYKVKVRLLDGARQLAVADAQLLNDLGRPTTRWEVGEEALNYHVLPIPLGTPPLTCTLDVAVYGAGGRLAWENGEKWFALGSVQLLQTVNQTGDPYGSWSGAEWIAPIVSKVAPGLLLEGYDVRPAALTPGDTVYVSLRWRAAGDDLAHYAPLLLLRQDETVLAQDAGSLFERYPTERWVAGELLIETRQLQMPPSLAPLQLTLVMGERTVVVGEIAVTREALLWEAPPTAQPICARLADVTELVGYECSEQLDKGTLTLYWRAPTDAPVEASYTVFTHLLSPEGALLAQHDGLPGGGKRPTTNWLPGEVIADRHELLLSQPYTGPARLVVGMYDLATMTRLPAYDCAGQRLPGAGVVLVEFSIGGAP